MARFKAKITLHTGETVYCSGKNASEAFNNLLLRCMKEDTFSSKKNVPTLKEYGEKWYGLYHVPKVGQNTANNTRLILKKHINPYIGDKPLDRITHDDIQMVLNKMSEKAASTVNKVKIVFHQIFSNAMEDGLLATNIMTSVRYVMSKKVTERNALSLAHAQEILMKINCLAPVEQCLLALLIYTGIRRGEALALTWSDIDFNRKLIHITKAVVFQSNRPVIKSPKSKAGIRFVPLPERLRDILLQCSPQTGYVITNEREPDIPLTEVCYRRMWERISKKIDLHGATAHVFRHTFDTMIQQCTDIKTLQSIMGHADIHTTMNRYTHPIAANIQALSEIDPFVTKNETYTTQ